MLTNTVGSSPRNLASGPKWRGFVDGLTPEGGLIGWALLASDPFQHLSLELLVHGIHVATVSTGRPRGDLDNAIGLSRPARLGYEFDLRDFLPEGALALLRMLEADASPIVLHRDVAIRIGQTDLTLPLGSRAQTASLDPAAIVPALRRAAARQLRHEATTDPDRRLSRTEQEIILSTSHLFAPGWYRENYGEVELTGHDPAQHYLRLGSELGRQPGPWFDPQAYLDATPSARESGLDALVHYEIHGHRDWWPGKGRFRATGQPQDGQRDHALLIHLYHLDTVPDLQRLVANFPPETDVFVTVPDDSPDHDPARIAEMFPGAEIMPVPNLGQDVGAFLAAVRALKPRGYRFFCKAHSKKGATLPEVWRRQMFDAIGATPQRVAGIIDLLRGDGRLLLLGPAPFWLDGRDFDQGSTARMDAFLSGAGFGAVAERLDYGFFAGTCFWIDAELAQLVADILPATEFVETEVSRHGQTAHIGERLFGLLPTALGGRVATVDGRDWHADPTGPEMLLPPTVRRPEGQPLGDFLPPHIGALVQPRNIGSAGQKSGAGLQAGLFKGVDDALHREIDVLISCWMGGAEPMHQGMAHLHKALVDQGLTSAFILGGRAPIVAMQTHCAAPCLLEPAGLHLLGSAEAEAKHELPADVAEYLLRSECMFRHSVLPEGTEREDALARIRNVHAVWREALIRHRVKTFLIWGNTAPKSRLFIHLCQDLGIEYQIIERGHFSGTISCDPTGQFGFGARPMLTEHGRALSLLDDGQLDRRFDEILAWHEREKENVAYPDFHQRETRDIHAMRRARRYGRPVILVIGANDQGSGVAGPEAGSLRLNWFESSDQAFARIRRMVARKFPDALLVLRPHPSQKQEDSEFVVVARETALDDLIEEADICITIVTSASALCLLKGKPVLSLGLSELNGTDAAECITDETHLLAALRRHVWQGFDGDPFPDGANKRHIVDLFERHLIGMDETVPTRHRMDDLARLMAERIRRRRSGFLLDYAGREDQISQAMFDDVQSRGRAEFRVDPMAFSGRQRPGISVVLPIYGDYEGTRICFEQLQRHQAENGYRVIMVWDRGPDPRLADVCREYAQKAGFTCLENAENVGFSGTVNAGMLEAGRDDVILLNSDTVPCDDWALRLQDAAYAHPKIGAVTPFSNNASICNLPFPEGAEMPQDDPVAWTEALDRRARKAQPFTVEMPVAHGFCVYIRRSLIDRIGLFSEMKYDRGYGEDNEFSLRARMAGYFCGGATNVLVGHAGSTSFSGDVDGDALRAQGRSSMQQEFSCYFREISDFYRNDPLARHRRAAMAE